MKRENARLKALRDAGDIATVIREGNASCG